ncbi:hypothetical protein KR093_001385 [Drosophila rubida]|uniref:Receptor expression-enhancing protein 2 n=1 Tax=Drosophila rubida TaxID=30044 RepID=A0AAD4K9J1_9MUSC|nr:hypothetical protein KR093_001385 [Drosophila rubida]
MSRPSYLQEQLLYQQHPANLANIKRLRQQALPVYGRSYSLEEQAAAAGNFVPVYSRFIYPQQQPQLLHYPPPGVGLQDSLNSLDSDFTDYDYEGAYILEQPAAAAASVPSADPVVRNLNALGRILELLQRWPLPRLSFNTACICSLIVIFIAPRTCAQSLLFPAFRLFFGTLYPAYASYKAVRTKNVKEYVKWMMYWIVFAFFTCIETFTDIFLSWFPFYYEVKVVIVLWLLSPATKGSSTLYRKFVHPMLTRREQEIDEYLNQARERGYSAVLQLGSKGVNYATNVIMQTAIKGGGNLVQTIKRSYSLSDLSEPDMHRTQDELDEVMSTSVMMRPQPARLMRQRHQTPVGRSASGTRHSTGMYFTEVDVSSPSPSGSAKHAGDFNYNIRSTDDISSGYSSAEPVSMPMGSGLSRTSSMTNASKARVKSKRNEQLLEDVRAEVYLDNERYFQDTQKQLQLQILESEEENEAQAENANEPEDEDSFHEALDEVENPLPTAAPETIEKNVRANEVSDNEESFKEALNNNLESKSSSEETKEVEQESVSSVESFKEALDNNLESKSNSEQESVSSVDPFLLVVTECSLEAEQERAAPVSPRELLATLEEIKHSFRAQLEADSPQPSAPRPRPQHAKGRAPAPPLPPRKDSRDTVSIASNASQQSERSKSGIGQLFKNIKDNVLRSNSSSSHKANQHKDEDVAGLSAAKETRI